MGKMQRDKGARFERQIVKELELHDIRAKRVPLSGATWLKGDVIVALNNEDYVLELKKRGNAFRQIYQWIDEADALVIAADRKKPLIVMDLDDFCDLYNNKEKS